MLLVICLIIYLASACISSTISKVKGNHLNFSTYPLLSNLELHTLVKLKLALTEEAGFLAPFNIGSTNIRVCSLLFVMKILCAPPKILMNFCWIKVRSMIR